MPALLTLHVADDPARWTQLGFTVVDGVVRIGTTDVALTPAAEGDPTGIVAWTLGAPDVPAAIEGITTRGETRESGAVGPQHPNGVTSIDHLVISTPDLERTVATFEALGMACLRRDGAAYGSQKMRQAFFWLGDDGAAGRVVLEVVGPAEPDADPTKRNKPAAFFGLALVSNDLDATCTYYGDLMKPPVDAVQAGRRISTLSSRSGCTVALAFMSPHVAETPATPDERDLVTVEVADRVAIVTLNRPAARNALSSALLRRLREAMAEADAAEDADAIILTGADPAFSAGLDLKELGSTGGNLGPRDTATTDDDPTPRTPWEPTTKPVIGAINGVAITGGFELALQCDFLVASEKAAFGDTHTRVGILPGWGLSVLLPQAIGLRRAIEMSLTGNFMSAHEARHFGLVNHVVPHDELMPLAERLATDIAGNNGPAVRELLASYRRIHRMTVGEGEVWEAKVGRDWSRRTYDPSAVEARRSAIMQRGRSQGQ